MRVADLVLQNGKIYSITSNGDRVTGEAVAVKDGLIEKIGSTEEVNGYVGDGTRVVDCKGNTILPGLCDAHCHPSITAGLYSGCDLFGVYIQEGESPEEIIDRYMERLKAFVAEHRDDELIRGTGWVTGNFTKDRMPAREDIDKICSDKPVILESFCQHNLWVNTKAIEMAGVDGDTPDVYAGKIHRDETGYPSGIFSEPEAMELIKKNVAGYDFSVEKYKESFLYYQKNYANKYGVTLVQDCLHSDNATRAYVELAKEGKLTVRARGAYLLEPDKFREQLPAYIVGKGKDNVGDNFRIDTIKIFAEGSFALSAPYEDSFLKENNLQKDYNGPLYWEDRMLTESVAAVMKAGYQVHVHAMGDKAVSQSIRCLTAAQEKTELQPRNVIAHLMLIGDDDVKAMARAKILANCQPRWMVYDSDINGMIGMVGQKRAEQCYPLRRFFDEGLTVAFGTDFPVTPPPDTMHEIQCAMTRRVFPDAPDYERYKGKVLGQERPASLEEAVKALSINGAYQMVVEGITGSIEEGKSAELVILDSDLEGVSVNEIYAVQVEKTIFKGRIAYEKQGG